MQEIDFATARDILNKREPVDLTVWKLDGSIVEYNNASQISSNFRSGYRRFRLNNSGEVRTVVDVMLITVNGLRVVW